MLPECCCNLRPGAQGSLLREGPACRTAPGGSAGPPGGSPEPAGGRGFGTPRGPSSRSFGRGQAPEARTVQVQRWESASPRERMGFKTQHRLLPSYRCEGLVRAQPILTTARGWPRVTGVAKGLLARGHGSSWPCPPAP